MSVTVFLALCVLGCDFLIYVLFHLLYDGRRPSRRKAIHALKQSAAFHSVERNLSHDNSSTAANSIPTSPFRSLNSPSAPIPAGSKSPVIPFSRPPQAAFVNVFAPVELQAHQRIAASFSLPARHRLAVAHHSRAK